MIRPLRPVPDDTHSRFMRGRFAGLIVAAVLSIAAVVMFFYPGFNYAIDFDGGVVVELRLPRAQDAALAGDPIRGFALIIVLGIVVGTSSSIFIASPILHFLGQKRLRPATLPEGALPVATQARYHAT